MKTNNVCWKLAALYLLLAGNTSCLWSQGTTIKVYARYADGNQEGVLPDRFAIPDVFQFYGASLALKRHKTESKFQEYEIGWYSSKNRQAIQELDQEIFISYQTNLFKKLMDKSVLKLYFSLGSRLFFAREEIDGRKNLGLLYPSSNKYYGIEFPVLFNVDIYFFKKLSLGINTNVIDAAYYQRWSSYTDSRVPDMLQIDIKNQFFFDFFYGWRIGLGYKIGG